MNSHQPGDGDLTAGEHLLNDRSASYSGDRLLAQLLAAATAPGRPEELAGETAALAAFRAARHVPTARPRRSVVKTTVLKLATVKLAVAALATTGTAGVAALAASTGALPSPFTLHAPAVTSSTSASRHSTEPSTGDRRPGTANALPPPASSDPGATSHAPSPSTVPSLSLSALCEAYVVGTEAQRLSALEMPNYEALIAAAGGKEKVDAYCANLLNLTPPTGSPTPTPTESSTPDPTPDPTPIPTSSNPTSSDPIPAATPTPNGSLSSAATAP